MAPIALFGCELLILNDKSVKLLEGFQVYAGKRIQRLFSKAPNICAFFGLGWMRLERIVEVKKVLFVRSLLALDVSEPSRMVFCKRVEDYLVNIVDARLNTRGSNVFDMLNVADDFGVLDEIVAMTRQGRLWSKDVWKRKIWKRAWELDECLCGYQVLCHRNLDPLSNICEGSTYLVWWQLSDEDHSLMKCWETMIRLVSHASLLRTDDVRLKGTPVASRFCTGCDLSTMDDVRHMVMQCPKLQTDRTELMDEISRIPDGSGQALLDAHYDLVYILLGKHAMGLSLGQMIVVWSIAARHITRMYNKKLKEGIG